MTDYPDTMNYTKTMSLTDVLKTYKPFVIVLMGGWNHSEGDVLAVFSTQAEAEKVQQFMEKHGKYDWYRTKACRVDEVTL
jgi:hypothetical protein